jgi:phage tail-like protein
MANGKRNYPYLAHNFSIEIDGIPSGAFAEVSGLTAEAKAVDYREGTDRQSNVRKIVGPASFTSLTLKRGYTEDDALWKWYGNILNGQPDRRNVTIVLMNEAREPVLRWHAENAFITKIEGPALEASGGKIAMESVVIDHDGLTFGG